VEVHSCREEIPSALRRDGVVDGASERAPSSARYVRGDLAVTCQREGRKREGRSREREGGKGGKAETREDSRGQDREFQELLSGLSTVVCVSSPFVPDRAQNSTKSFR